MRGTPEFLDTTDILRIARRRATLKGVVTLGASQIRRRRTRKRGRVKHVGPIYRMVQRGTVKAPPPGKRGVVFSYGAGLDSWWALVWLFTSEDPYAVDLRERLVLILHCDLGAEFEETTAHVHDVCEPFLKLYGWTMTIIVPRVTARDGRVYEKIDEYYVAQAAIPSKQKRSCTPRFKIGPLLAASKDLLGTDDYETIINYDVTERHRTDRLKEVPEKERERIRGRLHHPPMAMGKDRLAMTEDIWAWRAYIAPGVVEHDPKKIVPRKSACYFCIFQKTAEVEWMADHKPHFMEQAIALEEHMQQVRRPARLAKGKGDITVLHKSFRAIRDAYFARKAAQENQRKLFDLGGEAEADVLNKKKAPKKLKAATAAEQARLAM